MSVKAKLPLAGVRGAAGAGVAGEEGTSDESVQPQTEIQNFRRDKKTELDPADRQKNKKYKNPSHQVCLLSLHPVGLC